MKFGISTACFYPEDLLKSIERLTAENVCCMEIFVNTIGEVTKEFAKEVNSVTSSGIKITSVHPFTSGYEHILLFSDYYRRFEESIDFYKRYSEFACRVGADIVVLHGDKRFEGSGGISDFEYFERYYKLREAMKREGAVLAQENVNLFRSQSPEFIEKMIKYLGNDVDFVFDIKQAVRSKNNPFDVCRAMGNRIAHMHINDNDGYNDCLLPGKGTMDYEKILGMMRSQGYGGNAVIEVYRRNFSDMEDIVQSYRMLNRNFGNL